MKKKIFSRTLLILGLAVLMCGFSMQAIAMTFNFTEEAGFKVLTPDEPTSTDATTPKNDIKWYQSAGSALPLTAGSGTSPIAGEFNTLAWGVSNNAGGLLASDPWGVPNTTPYTAYSAIGVFGHSGTVDADGAWVTISQLFHQNSSIAAIYHTLATAVINGVLTISPADSGFPNTDDNTVTFNETLNIVGNVPTPVPDTFTINATTFDPVPFTWNGNQYVAEFQVVAIGGSTVSNNNGIVTITTDEGGLNEADVQMRIRQTPEPASIALLGLGLLGLGFIKRRRKNN